MPSPGAVCTYFYGLARRTGDIDYFTAVPNTPNIAEIAGGGSPLAKKWGISLHCVPFINLPDNYDAQLVDMMPRKYKNLRMLVLTLPEPQRGETTKPGPTA